MLGHQFKKGISLKPNFRKERKTQRELQKLYEPCNYLNPITLELLCKLSYRDGVFYLPQGIKPHGRYLFIRALSGGIFIAGEGQVGHHSYLSNGKKVLSAGYFEFENGKMNLVSNESGHYTPTNAEMKKELLFYFRIAKNQDLIYEDHSEVPTKRIISHYFIREIIKESRVKMIAIHRFYKPSNYGKKLDESKFEKDTARYLPDFKLICQKDSSHYLPDFWLFKPNTPINPNMTQSSKYKKDIYPA
ncbi:Uncharacterised protein [Legionella busanensis]|uniref:Uncharacterized protein n=1 Tax=Legionella busanensis TaxID=190655 RepID=A0A378KCM0_9GAMM|nr:hypothetical protein [Legionella busanensis]STX81365.1 Uncharacterised protein [Legionella busanensis]